MPTWFVVAPDGQAWVVRFRTQIYGRYRTQKEAFDFAVALARRLYESGSRAQVRVIRNEDAVRDALQA